MADSAALVYAKYVADLGDDEYDALWADYRVVGRLFGLREDDMPVDWNAFRDYVDGMLASGDLVVTDQARELAVEIVLRPPLPVVATAARRARQPDHRRPAAPRPAQSVQPPLGPDPRRGPGRWCRLREAAVAPVHAEPPAIHRPGARRRSAVAGSIWMRTISAGGAPSARDASPSGGAISGPWSDASPSMASVFGHDRPPRALKAHCVDGGVGHNSRQRLDEYPTIRDGLYGVQSESK